LIPITSIANSGRQSASSQNRSIPFGENTDKLCRSPGTGASSRAIRRGNLEHDPAVDLKPVRELEREVRALRLLPEVARLIGALPRKGPLPCHTADGKPWESTVQASIRRIVKQAGLAYCTLHDLGRTFVSQLAMTGVSEAAVQQLAGHTSISTTLKYHTYTRPENLRAAQPRLPFAKAIPDISDTYHGPHLAEVNQERSASS